MKELFQYKILLVDDKHENLFALSTVLKKEGYLTDTALSGKDALKLLLKNQYGLIILDVQMPEMNGFEVAELIKGNNKTKQIPLIFLSANVVGKEFFKKGHEVGALDYLAKPVDYDLLLLKVKNFLLLRHSAIQLKKANKILEKKAIEAKVSYHDLYYSLPHDVYIINSEGIILHINRTDLLECGMHVNDLLNFHYSKSPCLVKVISELEKESEFDCFFKNKFPEKKVEFSVEKTSEILFYGHAVINPTYIDGKPSVQILVTNVTDRVKAEANIRESELRLNLAQKIAKIGDWEIDLITQKISWSAEMYRIYDQDPDKFKVNKESITNLLHPEDRELFDKRMTDFNSGIEPTPIVVRKINSDNSIKYIRGKGELFFDETGKPIKTRGTAQDITELKIAELEIKNSAAFSKGILSSLNSFIAVIDQNGTIIDINESWNKIAQQKNSGTLMKVSIGDNYFEICENALNEKNLHAENILNGLKAVLNKESSRFDIEYPCLSSEPKRWFALSISGFDGDNKKAVLRFVDITVRKKSEQESIDNKKLIQSIYDASPDAVIITDGDGIITSWDKKSESLFGWKEHEVLGLNISETIMPHRYIESYLSGIKYFSKIIEGPIFKKSLETTVLNKNGIEFYVSVNISASLINEKRCFIGFLRDVSERKKAEQLLFESQNQYKNLIENMNDGVIVDDLEGKITFANEQFLTIFGIQNTDLKNINFEEYVAPEYRASLRERHFRRMSEEKAYDSFEFKGFKSDGELIWLEVRVNPIIKSGIIKGTQSVIRDITNKKNAEEVLIDAEIKTRNFANHLNKVLEDERSNLAREIHDELGQQLAGIKFGISSFKKIAVNNSELEVKINDLMKDVEITIQDLRKIATELRPGILDTLGLPSSIEWLVKGYEKKNGVRCNLKIDVSQQQFEKNISTCFFRICQESLTNISKHAAADEINIQLYSIDNKLVLIIKDNGNGMTINKQENPFSMGLIGMKERTKSIGGNFEIISEPGKGTLIKAEVNIN